MPDSLAIKPAGLKNQPGKGRIQKDHIKEVILKKLVLLSIVMLLVGMGIFSQADEGLKVFISVDMEGITGVVTSEECSRAGMDYNYFRRLPTGYDGRN